MTARSKRQAKRGGLATVTHVVSVFLILKDVLKGTIVPILLNEVPCQWRRSSCGEIPHHSAVPEGCTELEADV